MREVLDIRPECWVWFVTQKVAMPCCMIPFPGNLPTLRHACLWEGGEGSDLLLWSLRAVYDIK